MYPKGLELVIFSIDMLVLIKIAKTEREINKSVVFNRFRSLKAPLILKDIQK